MLSEINMLISSLGDYLVDEMAQSNESTREAFSNEIDKLETNIKQFHEESQKKSDEILSLLQKQELSKKEFEPLIEKNESTDNLEIASKQPEIQQEQHQEEDHPEEDHQQEQHQEEEREEKNQFTEETDTMKFRRILFTYHYGDNCNFRQCIFCRKGMITREEFKVVRLGYNFCCNANPNAIRGILPVCIGCRGWDGKGVHKIVSRRFYQHMKHAEKRNLVSSDEIEFIQNHNNINTFPIVERLLYRF